MEPHDLDRPTCIADNAFADRNFALPRAARIQFIDRTKDHRFCAGLKARDFGFIAALVIPGREVVQQIIDRLHIETSEGSDLRGDKAEMGADFIRWLHLSSITRKVIHSPPSSLLQDMRTSVLYSWL